MLGGSAFVVIDIDGNKAITQRDGGGIAASDTDTRNMGSLSRRVNGNVTPGTIGFIETRLKSLLAPAIYHEVMCALKHQVEQIQHDQVTLRFEPRTIEYEAATDTVFVYGYAFEK